MQRHLSFAVAVGVTQILLYAVGLPLVAYVFLWRHRGELDKPVVKFRYGLFFSGFRQERYYWECIVGATKGEHGAARSFWFANGRRDVGSRGIARVHGSNTRAVDRTPVRA